MILEAWNCSSEELNECKAMLSKNGKKGLCVNVRDNLKGCIGVFVTSVEGLLFKLFHHLEPTLLICVYNFVFCFWTTVMLHVRADLKG